MSISSVELLRFILSLLGDPTKAEAFAGNPSAALTEAGLSGISCADVDAISPLIANSVPGAVVIANGGGASAIAPEAMIQQLVQNVAVSNFDNSGIIQNIWDAGEVRQAFASEGGFALSGDLSTDDPIIFGDDNIVATDTAHAAGRDIIQNQADGNLALGGDQTIAQDDGVIAGGDNLTEGDKVGGNNNEAANTGNDNSVTVGNVSVDLSDDHSTMVGGNQNSAENTGNDNSTTVGGNQNQAQNTGNSTIHDESSTVGDVALDLSDNVAIGGDFWENGSNVGGIGNTDNRNSGNTTDSGNTLNLTENTDESINIGTIAVDLSETTNTSIVDDHSTTIGDVSLDQSQDQSTTIGDVSMDLSEDNSMTIGDVSADLSEDNSTSIGDVAVDLSEDNSTTIGDVAVDLSENISATTGDTVFVDDNSTTSGDTIDYSYTHTDSSTGGNFYEADGGSSYGGDYYSSDSGNTAVTTETTTTTLTEDYDYSFGG